METLSGFGGLMEIWAGTSGFSYKEWRGTFYPQEMRAEEMLRFYGERLNGVEINNTFYRFPKKSVLETWADQVPDDFRFVIKAPMRITHRMRLKEAQKEVNDFCNAVDVLKEKLGALLFQLPPNLARDDDRLSRFLSWLAQDVRVAMEFRHSSWNCDSVYSMLRAHNASLCVSDTDEVPDPELIPTANFGYLRLRREVYQAKQLDIWKKRIAKMPWQNAFVFFKHEDGAVGPQMAMDFAKAR